MLFYLRRHAFAEIAVEEKNSEHCPSFQVEYGIVMLSFIDQKRHQNGTAESC